MTKIKLTDYEYFDKVFRDSEKLRSMAYDYCIENASFWVDEYLHGFPARGDYSVGVWGYCFISFDDCKWEDVAAYVEKLEKDFGFFYSEEYEKQLANFKKYAPIIELADLGYIEPKEKDYNYMVSVASAAVEWFQTYILDRLLEEYKQFDDPENCKQYCLEMEYFDNLYIDEYGDICEDREPMRYDKIDIDTGAVVVPAYRGC